VKNFTKEELEKLKRIAKMLHLSGIPTSWIAKVLGINPRTIKRVADKSVRGRRPVRGKAFQKVIRIYAHHNYFYFQNKKDRESQCAKKLIEEWLGVEAVTTTFRSLDMLIAALRMPAHAPEQREYVELLGEIFNCRIKEAHLSANNLWSNYLSDISAENILPPRNTVELEKSFAAYAADAIRIHVAPRWSATAHQCIDHALETLPPRKARIIRMRFSIGTGKPAQTLQQTADEFNVSKESIWQVERRVLQDLRHPKNGLEHLMRKK